MKIEKIHIVIGLLMIGLAFFGMQYMAVFDSSTGVYWIEKTSYEADVGESISVTGKVWISEGGTYKLGVMKPGYYFVDNIATKTYGTISSAGYWLWTVNVPVTKSGEYEFYVIRDGNTLMGMKSITVKVPYTAPPDDDEPPYVPPTNPCAGIACNDYCVGTTFYYGGSCEDGKCIYSKLYKSTECGYEEDSCAGVVCDSYCDGITFYYDGSCVDGQCVFSKLLNATKCGYEEEAEEDEGIINTVLIYGIGFTVFLVMLLAIVRRK